MDSVGSGSGKFAFGDFLLDLFDERLIGPGGALRIGHKAFQVLSMLIEQDGRLITKDALFSSVWDGTVVSESSLTSVVKELRRALGDESRTPRFIESVYGRGYRFIAPVVRCDGREPEISPAAAASEQRGSKPEPTGDEDRPPIVLVSAFRDEAVRDHHPHCAAEMREEVISGLARVREIQLIADDRPAHELGRSWRDRRGYELSATLLPDRNGVKVISRARRLHDGVVVWAESMSLADNGTASGVAKIVRRIVGSALPALDEDVLLEMPIDSGGLYDTYLRAKRGAYSARSFADATAAADTLERIIAEQPGFGLAYPPLAKLYNTDFAYTALAITGPKERAYALKLAREGLAADRGNAHAHSLLGWCYFWAGERDLSRKAFDQALALNPYNHVRLEEAATAWMYMGDLAGARELMERSLELNPNPDDNSNEDWGRLHFLEGEIESARRCLEPIMRRSIWAELFLAACEIGLGRADGAERLRQWQRRVERSWHSAQPPEQDELLRWIAAHNPLPDSSRSRLIELVSEGLFGR